MTLRRPAQSGLPSPPRASLTAKRMPGCRIVDIGLDTVAMVNERLADARTIVWNGPLGAFEIEPFDRGTTAVAKAVARLTRSGAARSVVGGGDTVAALRRAQVANDFSFVSVAGGAFLELFEGKTLPGVAALHVPGDS